MCDTYFSPLNSFLMTRSALSASTVKPSSLGNGFWLPFSALISSVRNCRVSWFPKTKSVGNVNILKLVCSILARPKASPVNSLENVLVARVKTLWFSNSGDGNVDRVVLSPDTATPRTPTAAFELPSLDRQGLIKALAAKRDKDMIPGTDG